ncbi:Tetraspanin/Peripherin [Vigna unguiculata]|uniref:Tetraspanin/Peripherin n=1 Tax=Vigna unguiculata TaxID=3917 RepID=A0A4D6MSI8_VIGUN|nr:Tetraspanin/Peripherin [Vigna unguiculata]
MHLLPPRHFATLFCASTAPIGHQIGRSYCSFVVSVRVSIMVVSLAGFIGACYRNTFLMRLYLVVIFVVIAVLIDFIIFAYVVTDKGRVRG